jgi:hypothetical protein
MSVSQNITEGTVNTVSAINEYKPGKRLLNFRLLTDDEYPQMYEFTMYDKAIDKHLNKIIQGAKLKVQFNIKSREYNERLYFSLVPWSIESLSAVEPEVSQAVDSDIDEDVPF